MSKISDMTVYALPNMPEGYCLFAAESKMPENGNYTFVAIKKEEKQATLIDFCLENDEATTLWDNLENHGIIVSEICFTHGHRDHISTALPFLQSVQGQEKFKLPHIFIADDPNRTSLSYVLPLQDFYKQKAPTQWHFLEQRQPTFLNFTATKKHASDHVVYRLENIIFSGDERLKDIPFSQQNYQFYPAFALPFNYPSPLSLISLQTLLNQHFGVPPKRIACAVDNVTENQAFDKHP